MNRMLISLALSPLCGAALIGSAVADTSGKRIAFSNNYAGNSWRQAMLTDYGAITRSAVAARIVAAADVFTTADKAVPTQAAQIQNLILQGYDAIVINAASPNALNAAVRQACAAGIVVASFDGLVTEPCAYRIVVDYKDLGRQEVEHSCSPMGAICWRSGAWRELPSTRPSTPVSSRASRRTPISRLSAP